MGRVTQWLSCVSAVVLLLVVHQVAASGSVANDGVWEQLFPTGNGVSGRAWHSGAAIGRNFYVTGGSGTHENDTFAYDTVANTYTELAALPQSLAAAQVTAAGGYLLLFGGRGSSYLNELQVLRTTSSSGETWKLQPTVNSPPPRNGHSTTAIGGIVFVFGGWNEATYYNDVWAFDTTQLHSNNGIAATSSWVNVVPNNAANMPHARNSHSAINMGGRMVIFGGFWHDTKGGTNPYVSCGTKDHCIYFNDLWMWTPPSNNLKAGSYNPWEMIFANRDAPATPTAAFPGGRWGQVGAAVGDNILIFGGQYKGGTFDDTWFFNTNVRLWRQLDPPNALPGRRSSCASAVIGGMLYIFSGTNNKNDLWRFVPPMIDYPTSSSSGSSSGSGSGSGNSPTDVTCPDVSLGGVNAGLVISILLSLAVLAFTVLTYRRLSVGSMGGSTYRGMDDDGAL